MIPPRSVLVVALAAALACADTPVEPTESMAPQEPTLSSASGPLLVPDLDEHWASIARDSLAGFAGYWRTESGEYTIAVANQDRAVAVDWLRDRLAKRNRHPPVVARTVAFSFDELKTWKDALVDLLNDTNIFWVDIDETENRLLFGVEDVGRDAGAVDSAAAAAGVPAGAVSLVKSPRILPRVSLQNWVRPVVGGLRIEFYHQTEERTKSCTLGFNVYKGRTPGFVTNSHCSSEKNGLDGAVQYQALHGVSAHRIGAETLDPSSPRQSDAAYYRYDADVPFKWGHVARTLYPSVNTAGTKDIDTTHAGFRITSKAATSVQIVGELVNKVGQRTGWTQGQITQTCVTLSGYPCQWVALVYSQTGDSGSPIFQQDGPYEPEASEVSLWGILHGGPDNDWTTSWYSPIAAVEQDLGTLKVACAPSPDPCDPPLFANLDGPSFISSSGEYEWTGSATGGDGSYSYKWERRINHETTTCTFIGSWMEVATGPSYVETVNLPNYRFQLRLTVTSGTQTASLTQLVSLSSYLTCPY